LFFKKNRQKIILRKVLYLLPVAFIVFVIILHLIIGLPGDDFVKHRKLFLFLSVFLVLYVPILISAITVFVSLIIKYITKGFIGIFRPFRYKKTGHNLIYIPGLIMYFVSMIFILSGFWNTTNYTVKHVNLHFANLPQSFEGFKIMHISDLHLGSFKNTKQVEKAFKLIEQEKPDVLFLTGDVVNVSYIELMPYYKEFIKINPPYGKYCVLGNHDIGDYFSMKLPENQAELTQKLIETEKLFGFTLIVDSAVYIKKDNDSLAIAGVNNCSGFPFKNIGNLPKALSFTHPHDFTILLSHDPDLWKREVIGKTQVALTLSGHTHAGQIGIFTELFNFSPVEFKYHEFYGLYNEGNQFLYVNPGLGFSGYSARIGIKPEITCFTLNCSGK
jgi:predicted MPP superfamily phosphohydrolase